METQIHVPVGSPAIIKIPIFVNEQSVTEGAMKLIKELRPAWDASHVKTKVTTLASKANRSASESEARLTQEVVEHHQAPPAGHFVRSKIPFTKRTRNMALFYFKEKISYEILTKTPLFRQTPAI